MKKIILIRHADAVDNHTLDSERTLSTLGEEQLVLLKENFAALNLSNELPVYVSSSLRTQKTLNAIQDVLSIKRIYVENKLYLASKDTLLNKIQSQSHEMTDIVIIGHNPGLSDLVSYLSFTEHHCETASITKLESEIINWSDCDAHQEFKVEYIPVNTI